VAQVGSDVNAADRQQANAQIVTDSVDDRRQSVSGVSMDEEMSNLIRFQRAYQASSRAMSTMDEMVDVLINRTGRVGL
jgi:flagellar hook-associated protein 1